MYFFSLNKQFINRKLYFKNIILIFFFFYFFRNLYFLKYHSKISYIDNFFFLKKKESLRAICYASGQYRSISTKFRLRRHFLKKYLNYGFYSGVRLAVW